ncbi:unnamed protein product [Dracunculus medinensis]|uniref:Activin_recp domain-containing protein n=1 Tax=Dracunculus medinensis TaxID=318479 RepID=A0A0N4U1A8_DRAME|nr:unnamed protein product [Dracunculus medinensis]
MYEVSNSTWDYCVIIPSSSVRQEQGRLFGVGPDADWTKAYDNAFGISDNVYKILTLCLLEKYNFGFMTPNEHDRVDTPEYMFRCVCNYDLCNSATNFSKYLSNIMDENYVTLSSR